MGERKILAWILKTAQAMVGHSVDHLWIYLRRGVGLDSTLRRFSLPQPASPQIDEGLPGRVARTGVLIACQDVLADESFSQFYLPIFPKTRAQWCFPILAEGCTVRDEHFPVLCLDSQSPIEASLRSILDLLSLLGGLKLSALSGFHRLEQVQKIQDENDRWHLEQQIQELAGIRPEPTIRKLFDTLGSTFGPQGISLWQYNEIEDNLCHPIFSSQAPRVYRDYPRPGPWGAIGRVIASGQPLFCSRVSSAKDLKVSRFMSDLNVQATAYIPARLAIRLPAESVVPTKAKGVLFVNYEEEHRFSRLERKILLYAAEAAVEVLQLRSLARRHRLTEHFDLGEAYAYPGGTPSSEPAARAVLAALVSNHGYPHGVLYIKDRPGSLFVRSVWTSPLGKNFKGRYLESHPLFSLFGERWEPVVIRGEELEKVANVPEALQRGWTLALPLRQETDLLGFCLLSSEAPLSKKIEAEVAAHLPLFRQALETLLDLDRQARSNRRHVSLLAQFLRIYEYAARETSPTPLLTAFLDALLEGSTADACYIYLSSKRSDQDQPTLKVFRGDTSTSAARAMPPAFKTVFETDEPLFETNPVQTAGQRETVSGLEETDAGRVGIVSQVPRHPDVRAQVVLPLRFHQSRYGVLCVEYHVEHVFSAEDQWFFRVLIHQLGQALNYFEGNKILSERVKDLATSGTRIAHLGSPQFQEDVPVEEESRKLAVQAKEFSRADFVELWLLQDGVFVLQASDGADVHRRIGYERWNPETGLVA